MTVEIIDWSIISPRLRSNILDNSLIYRALRYEQYTLFGHKYDTVQS